MRRLWQMLAHNNGQTVNYSSLGSSLGVSNVTIRNYIDLLEGTFMLRALSPYFSNLEKRLVKAPKVYISDSGILSALLDLSDLEQIFGHPVFGTLWESVVLSNLSGEFPGADISFYRTSHGSEIDFIVQWKGKRIAIECKTSLSPFLSRGNRSALEDIKPDQTFIVSPVDKGWMLKGPISIVSLSELIERMKDL